MRLGISISFIAAFILIACGETKTADTGTIEKPKAVKAAKFKGAKLAPPSETMNYWAGIGTAQKKKYIRTSLPELNRTCRWHGPQLYWATPDKIDGQCRDAFDGFASKAVFTPQECFKGLAEGLHEFSDLTNIISCNGTVETPIGSGQVRLVMHKVNNEWFGFTESYAGWTAP